MDGNRLPQGANRRLKCSYSRDEATQGQAISAAESLPDLIRASLWIIVFALLHEFIQTSMKGFEFFRRVSICFRRLWLWSYRIRILRGLKGKAKRSFRHAALGSNAKRAKEQENESNRKGEQEDKKRQHQKEGCEH